MIVLCNAKECLIRAHIKRRQKAWLEFRIQVDDVYSIGFIMEFSFILYWFHFASKMLICEQSKSMDLSFNGVKLKRHS